MATAINVELKDFGKELQKIPKEMEKEVIDGVYSASLKTQEKLNKMTPVDTGALLAQWDIVKNPAGPEPSVVIGNTAKYASIVMETGAKPHWPPKEQIDEWASRQLKKPVNHPKVQKFSYFVRKKIAKRGIPASFKFTEYIEDILMPSIKAELDKILGD